MHTSPFADILGRNECFGLNASLNATRVKWAWFSNEVHLQPIVDHILIWFAIDNRY